MGQRSQIYIRYNGGKTLVAYHLQWNYGKSMINRAYQLLEFINKSKETRDMYSSGENLYYSDKAKEALKTLIQLNLTTGEFQFGHDLILEEFKYFNKENKDYFKINPKQQDNNNGILIIDIQDNGKIKYGFAVGYEGETKDDAFNIISARKYGVAYQDCANEKDMFVAEQQVKFIDNNFELLTQADYNEIFNQEYYYKDCLEKKE